MQKNFVQLFIVLKIACVNSLAFAQGNHAEAVEKYQALGVAIEDAKRTVEMNQNIRFMIVVGGVIAAALIAAAIFFRRQKSIAFLVSRVISTFTEDS